jgi:hypothetical protein
VAGGWWLVAGGRWPVAGIAGTTMLSRIKEFVSAKWTAESMNFNRELKT